MNKPSRLLSIVIGSYREWSDKTGRVHRHGGPAIECSNGTKQWCRHGEYITWQFGNSSTCRDLVKLPGYGECP